MRILVANDDGYLAPGLQHLHDALAALGDITVVAPEQDRSGASTRRRASTSAPSSPSIANSAAAK